MRIGGLASPNALKIPLTLPRCANPTTTKLVLHAISISESESCRQLQTETEAAHYPSYRELKSQHT
jgi:hypothetical protein